jgi:hypothetical protein
MKVSKVNVLQVKTSDNKKANELKKRLAKVKESMNFKTEFEVFEYMLQVTENKLFGVFEEVKEVKKDKTKGSVVDRVNAFIAVMLAYNNSDEAEMFGEYIQITKGLIMKELGVNGLSASKGYDENKAEILGQESRLRISDKSYNSKYRLIRVAGVKRTDYPQTSKGRLQFIADSLQSWENRHNKVGFFGRNWDNEEFKTEF